MKHAGSKQQTQLNQDKPTSVIKLDANFFNQNDKRFFVLITQHKRKKGKEKENKNRAG